MKDLVYAALGTIFKTGKHHQIRIKIATLLCVALGSGMFLLFALQELALPSLNDPATGYLVVHYTAQLLTLILLVSSPALSDQGVMLKLMQVLPLSKTQRWLLWIAPALLLTILFSLVLLPCAIHIAALLGCSKLLAALAYISGSLVGLAIICGLAVPMWIVRIPFVAAYVALEYIFVKQYVTHLNDGLLYGYSLLGILACIFLFVFRNTPVTILLQRRTLHVVSFPHIVSTWFTAKLIRDPPMRLSLCAAALLAWLITGLCHSQSIDPNQALWPVVAMLAAAVASDVRGTIANHPPEITALKGTFYFSMQGIINTTIMTVLALAPLVVLSSNGWGSTILTTCMHSCLGTAIGMAVGTIIRPAPRDITAQFTTMICTLLLFTSVQHFPPLRNLESSALLITYGILMLTGFAISLGVEYKHNSFSWRNRSWHIHLIS